MAVYKATNTQSTLTTVEFAPVPDGNFSFFHIKSPEQTDEVKRWLTSKDIGQKIVGEGQNDGNTVLVTRGDKSKDDLMTALAAHGDTLAPYEPNIPFTEKAWKTGATMAMIGQGMQLTSSFLRPDRKPDWGLRMLAIPNLIATTIILIFGAQRSDDTHRLRFLKEKFNDELQDDVPDGLPLPAVDETRSHLRKDVELPSTPGHKIHDFLKHYSVVFGEIGLRYFGAIAMAFPIDKWKQSAQLLQKGALEEAYLTGRNMSPLTHYAGLASLTGKTIALGSKVPDPYDPKPHTWLDDVREKFTFRTGGWIETAAFAAVAIDGFRNKKISFVKGGKEYRDFISGIGGTLFTIRYAIRHWAPFGVKDTNMDELYAHVTDTLALVPPDKLPNLLAQTAGEITDHFKDKRLNYSDVYTKLKGDLYRYHHIGLDNLSNTPSLCALPEETPESAPAKYTAANPPRPPSHQSYTPAGTYAETVKASSDMALGRGA